MQGKLDCYDFVFLALDPEDVYCGTVEEVPGTLCACLRFRGSHREALQGLQASSGGNQPAGLSGERMVQRDCPGG